MELRTNRITVRGTSFTVQEPSGAIWLGVQKLLGNETTKHRVQYFVVQACCVDPAFATETDAMALPQKAIEAIWTEALRLKDEDLDPKVVPVG